MPKLSIRIKSILMFFKNSLIACLLFTLTIGHGQNIKVMTYNIKYDNTNDTINNWNYRKAAMVDLVDYYGPDVVGMQEVLHNQLTYLNDTLKNYQYVGVGRDDGKQKGEYSPIFYNTEKLKLLQSNTFWLSPTPDKVSVGWDAALERICTYGLFEEIKSKKRFWVFNTHFDHIGEKARENSVRLIVKKITETNLQNLPAVLMGDLNLRPDTEPIQYLRNEMVDGKESSNKLFYGPSGTFNGFDQNRIIDQRIDYIFLNDFEVDAYIHIDDRLENNKHISDHLPVLATLSH